VTLEKGAKVHGSELRDAVVGPHARLGSVRLHDSLVGAHAELSNVSGSVLVADHTVIEGDA
jgi:hypothetical protein